ncbi:hypothetical protein AGR6A_pTi0027 [Agrobacterium sp. NCPPB 925]|nr:hypothetical protein AGR6A_pTi0027 [Agrobacterium sp. NCPPB 925]
MRQDFLEINERPTMIIARKTGEPTLDKHLEINDFQLFSVLLQQQCQLERSRLNNCTHRGG